MNRRELAQRMSAVSNLTQKNCIAAIVAFMEILKEVYHNNDELCLTKFGRFYPVVRKERRGVNPLTKKHMMIPSKKVFKFKSSKFF